MVALLYHNVGPVDAEECRGLSVLPETFARQIAALAAMGYRTVSASEWSAHVRGGASVPRHPIMITFDDCYADLPAYAFPTLDKHGFSATVFVPTSLVGRSIPCSPGASSGLPIMPADTIAEWAARGIEFGAHSRTHADLSRLPEDVVLDEMQGSKEALSEIIGRPVAAFAYPYGRADAVSRRLAGELFDTAFTIEEGINDQTTPLTGLRRTMVQHGDSRVDVCLRARFGMSILERVRTAAAGTRRSAAPA